MILELLIAFTLVLAAAFLIYAIGRAKSPKTKGNENQESSYACGEKVIFRRLSLNISLYKFLVYFIIVDSSVLLVAFASIASLSMELVVPLFLIYLSILFVASVLLVKGGRE
ncbi:MAG TPA: NADH-quinone oxidoreductase subunit A [Candidatus Lokiarchaeia archaeon]|nr:NADH-quinone oxidoreductase subunit A [Candidatus Lokiarchaeia archaeon]